MIKVMLAVATFSAAMGIARADEGRAWKDCTPNSIGPGGCDSIAPGGGMSIGPGGGLSIAPGGGLSIGPGGGQSIAPDGGQNIGPGGGKAIDRDRTRGLDPDTMRPYPEAQRGIVPPIPSSSQMLEQSEETQLDHQEMVPPVPPRSPVVNYSGFDGKSRAIMTSESPDVLRSTLQALQQDAQEIIGVRTQYLVELARYQSAGNSDAAGRLAQRMIAEDAEIRDVQGRIDQMTAVVRKKLAPQ